MATAKISELTIGTPLSGSELFEMTQETNSFSASAGMIKEYVLSGYAKITDTKAYNVNGGTFTQGAWQTRDLNTINYNPDGIVKNLASNQFTLGPGKYRINAKAIAHEVNRHVSRLYNISDSSEVILGTTATTDPNYGTSNHSFIDGEFIITGTKIFEIQHQCSNTFATIGFGNAINISGISNIYVIVELWKLNS